MDKNIIISKKYNLFNIKKGLIVFVILFLFLYIPFVIISANKNYFFEDGFTIKFIFDLIFPIPPLLIIGWLATGKKISLSLTLFLIYIFYFIKILGDYLMISTPTSYHDTELLLMIIYPVPFLLFFGLLIKKRHIFVAAILVVLAFITFFILDFIMTFHI